MIFYIYGMVYQKLQLLRPWFVLLEIPGRKSVVNKAIASIQASSTVIHATLLFYQIEPLKNGASLILPSSISRNS